MLNTCKDMGESAKSVSERGFHPLQWCQTFFKHWEKKGQKGTDKRENI